MQTLLFALMSRFCVSIFSMLLLSNLAFARFASAALTHEQLQAQIDWLEMVGFFSVIALLACILFVLVYAERAIKRIERILLNADIRKMPTEMPVNMQRKQAMNVAVIDKNVTAQNSQNEQNNQAIISDDAPMQDTIRQNQANQDVTSQDVTSQDATRQDAISQDATRQNQASQDATSQDITSQDTSSQDASSQDTIRQDATRQDVTSQDASRQDATSQDTIRQDATSQDTIRQDVIRQDDSDKEEASKNTSDKDAVDKDNGTKMQDIQHAGVLAMDGGTDGTDDTSDDISNLPGIVAQYAFPESLEALRRTKPSGTSEHDLWRWVQDVLLHLPKYGLKNDGTMMLPEKQEDYKIHHRLEQGLRHFNMNQFSDALQEFFQVSLRSENMMQQLSADFMKMQILFRLELWVDGCEIAEKIIHKYQKHHKMRHNNLIAVSFATAYMVRGAYRLQFLDDEDSARNDMNKAISYTVNMDNHDMLMAGVMMHVHLFKVALHARSNPAASLKAMQTILRLFAETVIPEIQTVRDNIKEFF